MAARMPINSNSGSNNGQNQLERAVYQEAYLYLESMAPQYLTAIEVSIAQGDSPDEIRQTLSRLVGPDRQAFVRRCWQAAMHVESKGRVFKVSAGDGITVSNITGTNPTLHRSGVRQDD